MLKKVCLTCLVLFNLMIMPISAKTFYKWHNNGTDWYYYINSKPAIGLQNIDNNTYFFNAEGKIQYGWINYNNQWLYVDNSINSRAPISKNTWMHIDNKWYYFDSNGIMLHDAITSDGYQLGSDGVWIK